MQLEQIYDNLEAACRAYGGSLTNMVKTTTYIVDPEHFAAVSKIRQERYCPAAPPNATLIVAGLAKPEWMAEIEGTAWIE
mgnify:FL=1